MADADSGILRAHEATHILAGTDAFLSTDLIDAVIRRLRTTTGPADLLVGAIVDGEFLKRSGTAITSAAVTGNPKAVTVVVHPTVGMGDYTTIAAALADVTLNVAGGTVFVREGTYAITATLTLPNVPVRVIGMGPGATLITLGASAINAFTAGFGQMYEVSDLRVTGTRIDNQSLINIAHASANVVMHQVTMHDCSIGIVYTAAGMLAMYHCQIYPEHSNYSLITTIDGGGVAGVLYMCNTSLCSEPAIGQYGRILNGTGLSLHGLDSILVISAATIANLFWGQGVLTNNSTVTTVTGTAEITATNMAALGNWTFSGIAILTNLIEPNGTYTFSGAAGSLNGFRSRLYAYGVVVVSGATMKLSNCELWSNGAAYCLDVASGGSYIDVTNCIIRGSPTTAGIRTSAALGNYTGITYEIDTAVPTFLEAGSANNNRLTGQVNINDASGPTIIGADTVVEGVRKKGATAVATVNTLTSVLTHRNQNGLTATEGTIINRHASASLTVRETVTDFVGPTTETRDTDVAAGANLRLSPYGRLVAGGLLYYAFGPFKTYSVEVRSTVTNAPATYDLQCASIGAE